MLEVYYYEEDGYWYSYYLKPRISRITGKKVFDEWYLYFTSDLEILPYLTMRVLREDMGYHGPFVLRQNHAHKSRWSSKGSYRR